MIRWLVGSSLRFRGLVIGAAAVLLVIGVTQLNDAPVDVLPEFSPPTVEIQAEALGLSAIEVEQLVTSPFEQDSLNGVAFLEEIRSETIRGLTSIEMIFEPGTDVLEARQVVQERLAESLVALPGASDPPRMIQPLSSANRVMMIGVSAAELTPVELSVLARWTIEPELLSVPGVANVAIWGFRDRQLQVQVDPQRLQSHEVSLTDVVTTAGNALWASPLSFVEASVPGVGGFIDTANQRLSVRHVSPIITADQLGQVPVEGAPNLTLPDVADVVEEHQPLIGDAIGPDLVMVVEKFPNSDTLTVTSELESRIAALQPGLAGVDFDTTIYRPATFIDSAIDNLLLTLIIAAALVALTVGAFFFSWRRTLVSLIAIPTSVIVAALVLYLLGASINSVLMVGLVAALLIVIDDATIDVESYARRLRERREARADESAQDVILTVSAELRNPMLYGALIMALAAVPLLFLEGVSGAFLPDVLSAYLIAIAVSLLVALTLTPVLSLLLGFGSERDRRTSPVAAGVRRGYDHLLSVALRRRAIAYIAVGAIAIAGIAAVPFLNHSSLPQFKETELLIEWNGAPGTSLPESARITAQATSELRQIPGVRSVQAQVGRAITGDRVASVDSSELWVSIDPDADYEATVRAVDELAASYPGFETRVVTYSNARVQEVLDDTSEDLTVRVFGVALDTLEETANDVLALVAGTEGVVGGRLDLPDEEPTVEVEVDLEAAQAVGVKPGDVRRAAAILLSGINVGSLFEEQKVFDVIVWGVPQLRQSFSDVLELPIETPTGGQVPLGTLADIRIAPNPTVIRHESVSRYIDVTASVDGRSVAAVEDDVERAIAQMAFPLEYHAEIVRDDDGISTALLIGMIVAATLGAFLLLQACFGTWRHAALALVLVPLSLAGGTLAVLIDGGTASLGSLVGFFAVGGLAARHALLLIKRCLQLEHGDAGTASTSSNSHNGHIERVAFGPELVRQASRELAAPIALTTIAVALATVPVLARGSIAGHELLQPLAVVLLGGVLTAALINLFLLPLLYLRLGPTPAPVAMGLGADELASAEVASPFIHYMKGVSMRDRTAVAPRRLWPGHAGQRAFGLLLVVGVLFVAGCGGSSESGHAYEEPAVVETNGELALLTLSAQAVERLDIQMASVEENSGAKSIPYAAVLYEPNGTTWPYTSPEELVFTRASITVERIVDDTAFLSEGPPTGTDVVTVGVAELWGTELGIE